MSKAFNIKTLLKQIDPILGNFAEEGPGWSIGSTGPYPGQSPPQAKPEQVLEENGHTWQTLYCIDEFEIQARYKLLKSNRALRIEGQITNKANQPARVHRIRSLAIRLAIPRSLRACVFSLKGGIGGSYYPPPSFTFAGHELIAEPLGHGTLKEFDSGLGGYSTNNDTPLFVLQLGDEGGLFYGLEWPGAWWCGVNRLETHDKLWIELGPVAAHKPWWQRDEIDVRLEPGESIPLPAVVVGLYRGDMNQGCNTLRRLIRDLSPVDKISPSCPINYNNFFATGLACTADIIKKQTDICAKIGVEYMVFDAGWYKGSRPDGWDFMIGTGNWRQENPEKFPQGFAELSGYIHAKGMKAGIWVAPENCHRTSDLACRHPEWMIFPDPDVPSMVGNESCIVNFGIPEVVEWFKETVDLFVSEFKIDWIRWDLNLYPEPYWAKADPPHRRGITQIRHIEGILEFWDYILKAYPHLIIEACCGGGRRMDLACLKRSHTYWANDETRRISLQRYENTGANTFLPSCFLNRMICFEGPRPYPASYFHALMGGTLAFSEDMAQWTSQALDEARRHIDIYKQIRPLLLQEFTNLFPSPVDLSQWVGWQFHDPHQNKGVLFLFRVKSPQSKVHPRLRDLKPDVNYIFVDPYTKMQASHSGQTLLETGLPVELPEDSSCLYQYRPEVSG